MDLLHITTQVEVHKIKFKAEFERTVSWFLKDFLNFSIYMPIPPLDHFGRKVDLFDLYTIVETFGGIETVNKYDLWASVALKMGYGYGLPKLDLEDEIVKTLKAIYGKYLQMLNWYHLKHKGREIQVNSNEDISELTMNQVKEQSDILPPKKRSRTSSNSS
ncbi:ARID DNA-binding domain, Zinc finger, CCHC-type [Artemisia annua]|uniref:ARID DNA-binding domain, Zinc finger, CCHC-type n=1 Tax=Artemisia annua TaxID=35608 RepID=A0A2U1NGW7_ARTAN|nr:ARID DNA-binding domain, Zinc finger, CCHC-type [Artemisia annua]